MRPLRRIIGRRATKHTPGWPPDSAPAAPRHLFEHAHQLTVHILAKDPVKHYAALRQANWEQFVAHALGCSRDELPDYVPEARQ